jgi:hypothetical protein
MFFACFSRGAAPDSTAKSTITGAAPDGAALQRAIDDFSLAGRRPVTKTVRGNLTVAVTSDRPVPPTATEAGGRRFVVASGDAYDVATTKPGHSELAETLLRGYVGQGAALTPPRNGTFAFLAHDAEKDEVVLGNDAFGFHPLFILETPGFVAVASEVEPLMALAPGGRELDPDGVAEFFVFGSTLGGRTLVRGVRNLDPGTVVTITRSDVKRRTHDTLDIAVDHTQTFEQHAKRVADAFKAAVQRRIERHPAALASLTGGADTRLILSCMTPAQRKSVSFVTHYIIEGKADDDRDVVIARMVAKKAGVRHEAVYRAGAREHFSPEGYRKLRERPVHPEQIHGVWGGEYLGGAAVDVAMFPVERITREAVAARVKRLLSPELQRAIVDPYDTLQAEYARCKAGNREFQFWIGMFARPYMTHLYFGSAGISSGSWMWPWAQNLRLTSPFQDAEFLRTLLAVPFEYVSGYRLYNEIYRAQLPEFTDVPTNSGLAVRSDSALTMYVEGREPKRAHKDLARESRKAAFQKLDASGSLWQGNLFARDAVRAQCLGEVEDHPPTMMQRVKNTYTQSFLFKSRKYLPLHGMLMKWKAKHETTKAATLESVLVGAVVDFDYWCTYAGVPRTAPKERDVRRSA